MEASAVTTSMPYLSYVDIKDWLALIYQHTLVAVDAYFNDHTSVDDRSAVEFQKFCQHSAHYTDIFRCDGYRLCRAAKLLMALGYGNFTTVVQYDAYAMAEKFASGSDWSLSAFKASPYNLVLDQYEANIANSPNLSIFPLLAYHKIVNDHYRNEKWQPFEPWTCNIDYVGPTDNMNVKSFISSVAFSTDVSSIIDLENSNLPLDYFTAVLPRAQYGDESAVQVNVGDITINKPVATLATSVTPSDTYVKLGATGFSQPGDGTTNTIGRLSSSSSATDLPNNPLQSIKGDITASSSLKISALRSATALQKYKEIQNSNDPDFANQVLAHFGIKPKVDARTSIFIGGDDKTLTINPQVNTNFQDGAHLTLRL